ncbi:hypothetical protein PN36_33810 [Candidatus Thiomargarita nelsonii]|uniref:Uncharacterized protein n=1 Tax=Candidatus Thiomargarita nelsonii TaxID=1003181 RepID=A0A4E0QWQ2_9GAMM|nr:hypothetical protein PN36_33810 [Candidatus Thiomargarita nelsonii]
MSHCFFRPPKLNIFTDTRATGQGLFFQKIQRFKNFYQKIIAFSVMSVNFLIGGAIDNWSGGGFVWLFRSFVRQHSIGRGTI